MNQDQTSETTSSSDEFVSKFYEMNPQTDDLLPDGRDLKNGMIVLIEGPMLREDVESWDENVNRYNLDRAKQTNRWATVSHVDHSTDLVSFVAVYADGTKRKRTYSCGYAWLVKLDSIPKTLAEISEENLPTPSGDISLVDYTDKRPK